MRLKMAVLVVLTLFGFALLVGLAVTREGDSGRLADSARILSLRLETYAQAFRALLLKINFMK